MLRRRPEPSMPRLTSSRGRATSSLSHFSTEDIAAFRTPPPLGAKLPGGRNTADNFGAASFLCVGNDQANSERVLLHFDLSSLRTGATVTSCLLTFTVNQVSAPTAGRILRLRRNDWSEASAGSAASDVDATNAVTFTPLAAIGAYTFPSIHALCQDAVQNRAGRLDLLIRQDVDQEGSCSGSVRATRVLQPKL